MMLSKILIIRLIKLRQSFFIFKSLFLINYLLTTLTLRVWNAMYIVKVLNSFLAFLFKG